MSPPVGILASDCSSSYTILKVLFFLILLKYITTECIDRVIQLTWKPYPPRSGCLSDGILRLCPSISYPGRYSQFMHLHIYPSSDSPEISDLNECRRHDRRTWRTVQLHWSNGKPLSQSGKWPPISKWTRVQGWGPTRIILDISLVRRRAKLHSRADKLLSFRPGTRDPMTVMSEHARSDISPCWYKTTMGAKRIKMDHPKSIFALQDVCHDSCWFGPELGLGCFCCPQLYHCPDWC